MSVINTNITSMIGQQNLSKSQNALQTSMERLSSGLRINSAKDDAAGQAIANRMSAQITGLNQASRNANDGISVSQTAEGALNQINDNVQRIRELTVQAQNGTNSTDDLQSIQDEINQRTAEIDRVSSETNFNGVKVLAENQSIAIQVGANDGETINVGLRAINSETLGLQDLDVTNLPRTVTAADVIEGGETFAEGTNTIVKLGDALYSLNEDSGVYSAATVEVDAASGVVTVTEGLVVDPATPAGADLLAQLEPLGNIDDALKNIDSLRSDLGAVQNRFEDAINNLNTNSTNLSAARSRIEDADYAMEVANMTRAQILQQAGTSVLAQANQIPQNV
ncbi:MAG: flagellin FliC, partial [Halomonas sp.]|uniref:flagellin N-terminal helical domain-containing protein n=1 Tax=Halomonas sp. TaxID=1486246 RepID=UPI0019FC1547